MDYVLTHSPFYVGRSHDVRGKFGVGVRGCGDLGPCFDLEFGEILSVF